MLPNVGIFRKQSEAEREQKNIERERKRQLATERKALAEKNSAVVKGELYPPHLPGVFLPPIPVIESNCTRNVVGESNYSLGKCMKRARIDPDGWKNRHFLCFIAPQPDNQYDPHAVLVAIVSGYDTNANEIKVDQVGYIAATQTGTWHKLFADNEASYITAWGRAVGKEDKFGMKLDARKKSMTFLGENIDLD